MGPINRATGASVASRRRRRHLRTQSHTIWHSHPYGQLLIITGGAGWLQTRGNPAVPIQNGDTAWIEPGEEHWHGSAEDTMLRHLSIQEHRDGQDASFAEPLARGTYPPNRRLQKEC